LVEGIYLGPERAGVFLLLKDRYMLEEASASLKPRYLAQKCPVCNGWGTVSFKHTTCHACKGKGFVLIPTEKERQREYEEHT